MKSIALFFFVLSFTASTQASSFDHNHTLWNEVLKKHVKRKGSVSTLNYKALKTNTKKLDAYLKQLSAVGKKPYASFNEKQKLSFLINAYNAFTVKLILDNYPVKSIRKIGGLLSSPWKKKFFTLLGEKTHLDHVEHGIIRKDFKEPRIHFAVVCASVGCPGLLDEAFTPEKLEAQLQLVTKNFLTDPTRNKFDPAKKELTLSKIFKWYGEDFEKHSGSVKAYVAQIMTPSKEVRAQIKSKATDIEYFDYDWSLNEPKKL